jgi:hypothetical protein
VEHKSACRLEGRFCDATPSELVHMLKHSVNEHGRPLSQFEFEALCEQWLIQFGQLPPDSEGDEQQQSDDQPRPTTEERLEDQLDDTMLRTKDVVRRPGYPGPGFIGRCATESSPSQQDCRQFVKAGQLTRSRK